MPSKKITEYILVTNSNPLQVSNKVNECIEQGWVPLAGVSVGAAMSDGNSLVSYAQAMVKYKVIP